MKNSFIAAAVLSTCALAAQTIRFETATISKSHASGTGYSGHVERKPGQPVILTLQNVSLQFCIQQAYAAKAYQVTGPNWIKTARYDVTGTMASGATVERVWLALRTLLEERLDLGVRREPKELLLYAMRVAPDGPKMPAAGGGPKGKQFQPGAAPEFGDRGRASGTMRMDNAEVSAFCDSLSRRANHPVVDRTGLDGAFKIEFDYSGSSSSALSKALEKQLGLKLEPAKDTIEMLIVERAQRKPREK
jgi:uncharacterized protein (TIGR03435 family)